MSGSDELPKQPLGPRLEAASRLPPPPLPVAPEPRWIPLAEIVETNEYRLRPSLHPEVLAESIARRGQVSPVDLRPIDGGLQLVAGHRRYEATKLLHRTRILARIHEGLTDDEALFLALADDLDRRPWTADELERLEARLEASGWMTPRVQALLERARGHAEVVEDAVAPGREAHEALEAEEEIEIDVLADRVRDRLADGCNDLAVLYECWADLDEGRRADLLECVRYLAEMLPLLAEGEEER
ncbi:MAG: hypothetical protein D6729_13240 [Deltaproteobacteria bacterium]|nr:MAG: hypothetical protein D6729_13240 [Deltaproteobacteria bacterium]